MRFLWFEADCRVKYVAIAIVTILLSIALFGLVSKSSKTADTTPIPIAVMSTLASSANSGKELAEGVQLYIDTINRQGGIKGHPLKLLIYDDQTKAEVSKQVALEAANSPALAVIGHWTSDQAIAAGSVYKAHRLPAITGTANAEAVTANNPYFFRAVYDNSAVGRTLALYAQQVLEFKTASIILSKGNAFGESLSADFVPDFKAGGTIKHIWEIDPNNQELSIRKIVDELAADPDPEMVLLALTAQGQGLEEVIVAIKRRGLKVPLIGHQIKEGFAKEFEKYPEEKVEPGFFTNGLYTDIPFLLDSAGADAQEFAIAYQNAYGHSPSLFSVKFYEATVLMVEALKKADIKLTAASRDRDREQVRAALAAIDSPQVAIGGLTGSLYFNNLRSIGHLPVKMAQFHNYRLISAPEQFTPVINSELVDLPRELKAGTIVQSEGQYFWKQDVVYVGIDINQLSRVDQKNSSFTANFYLWFRYPGDAHATDVTFPGGTSLLPNQPLFDPVKPLEAFTINGLNYRLYEIRGEFKSAFDLHKYPFDQQQLNIRFQNHSSSHDRLIYVIDTFGLRWPRTNTPNEQKPYQSLQQWKFRGIHYAQETFRTTSTIGDPRLFNTNVRTDYPGFSATIAMQRRPIIFLVKNLLPLFLLTFVPLMALYFPHRLSKERPPVVVSALITGIVLLVGNNNQLPEVGYTTALEYGFYIFFGLSLFSILVGIISDRLILKGHKPLAVRLDWIARFLYYLMILCTIAGYWFVFRDSLS